MESDEKGTAVLTVTGITENYVSSYIYVSPQAYEKAYGEQPEYNMVLAVVPEADEAKRDEVSAAVLKTDLAAGVSFTDSIKESFGDLLSKIDYIVVVLIGQRGGFGLCGAVQSDEYQHHRTGRRRSPP